MLSGNGIFARFTAMSAHLSILIMIFKEYEQYINFCGFPADQYDLTRTRFIVALSFSIGLLIIELIIFLLGVSLLHNKVTLATTILHSAGAISLSFMVFTRWCSVSFWPIFAICSCVPFLIEIFNAIVHNITH